MLEFALILLVIFSVAAIQTRYLRHAVIYLAVFSLSISFVYLLYNAPDVAIAEAVVGSTIATILYLVALQKYKIFTIYYLLQDDESCVTEHYSKYKLQLLKTLEKFCTKQELEAQVIFSSLSLEAILQKHQYALIVDEVDDTLVIYGHHENNQLENLDAFLKKEIHFKEPYRIEEIEEVIE
ncbi:Na(+)/H(+) antiporter subunit B [Fusibacter sp. JL298sf-3]